MITVGDVIANTTFGFCENSDISILDESSIQTAIALALSLSASRFCFDVRIIQ